METHWSHIEMDISDINLNEKLTDSDSVSPTCCEMRCDAVQGDVSSTGGIVQGVVVCEVEGVVGSPVVNNVNIGF